MKPDLVVERDDVGRIDVKARLHARVEAVLVRDKDTIKLYTKGADNIIFNRLKSVSEQPFYETAEEKLEEYSKFGYRTLVYAMRIVSPEEYQELLQKIDSVSGLPNFEDHISKDSLIPIFTIL